jgi:hypothetical protein
MPDGVREIGVHAFRGCDRLECIAPPPGDDGGKVVGEGIFADAILPAALERIGCDAFRGCYAISSVRLPAGLLQVDNYAFDGCHSLKGVYVLDLAALCGVRFGYEKANPLTCRAGLWVGDEPVERLVIPDGVGSIAGRTFCGAQGLCAVVIPESVTEIGDESFYDCPDLAEVTLPARFRDALDRIFDARTCKEATFHFV